VKELEEALMDGRADLAVHSMKDVPVNLPEGFVIAAVSRREDPRDAFVSNHHADIDSLPAGARVGTSSLRREAQLRARRPDLVVRPVRGNVQTRLRKLDEGEFDAILLAAAGLKRLGLAARIRSLLEPAASLPAVGQGALGIECRATVREIVPESQAATRTFQVKVTGPCPPGVTSGMFGRISVPLDEESLLVLPERAIRRVGQLAMVDLVADGRIERRAIRLGRAIDGDREVLSGLRAGDRVMIGRGTTTAADEIAR
jgi:hypothetical protein